MLPGNVSEIMTDTSCQVAEQHIPGYQLSEISFVAQRYFIMAALSPRWNPDST